MGEIGQDLYKINNTLNRLTDGKKSKVIWECQRIKTLSDDEIRKGLMEDVVISMFLLSGRRSRKDYKGKRSQDRKVWTFVWKAGIKKREYYKVF